MTLPAQLGDREKQKFIERTDGQTSVAVDMEISDKGGRLSGVSDTVYASPHDFTAAYTSATTITLTGLSYTPKDEDFIKVIQVPSGGGQHTEYSAIDYAFDYASATGILTVTGASFASGDTYRVEVYGPDKRYNQPSDATKTLGLNPDSETFAGETLADVTDGADDTYYYYVDMAGYRKAGFQLTLDGGSGTCTVTCEGTIQDDGTAASSCTYQDITNDTFGVANTTSSDMWIDDAEKLACFKYVRLKVVAATGAADDADWTIYAKRLY